MEIKLGHEGSPELDPEGDMIGVILDKPVICGFCMIRMQEVSRHLFRCPRCGAAYDEFAG
jgi:hypothetical protein